MIVRQLLESLYPGENPPIVKLRQDLERIAHRAGQVNVLIEGPAGSGKTAMARALAVCRKFAMLAPDHDSVSVDQQYSIVLGNSPIRHYRDMSLAGLTEALVDSQLFGVGPKAATDVNARIGIFEQAMTGFLPSDKAETTHPKLIERARADKRVLNLVTGGVVLLDEIGDIPAEIQPKLLRVLNGEIQFRHGTEGHKEFGFEFKGMTIFATWKHLSNGELIRKDLWDRICQNRIKAPSLSDYSADGKKKIIHSLINSLRKRALDETERLQNINWPESESTELDGFESLSESWRTKLGELSKLKIPDPVIESLCGFDWNRFGEFRGLRSAIDRLAEGVSLSDVQKHLAADFQRESEKKQAIEDDELLKLALKSGTSLSKGLNSVNQDWAQRVNDRLVADDPVLDSIIFASGKDRNTVKKQIDGQKRKGKQRKAKK